MSRLQFDILWHSPAIYASTGYGIQSANYVIRLIQKGYKIAVCMTNERYASFSYHGIPHFAGGFADAPQDDYGVPGILNYSRVMDFRMVVTLFDLWPLHEVIGPTLKRLGVKWAPMAPIDSEPMTRATRDHLLHAEHPIAFSQHGMRMMDEEGISHATYIPHGVDTNLYKPMPRHKEMYKARGKFLVGTVATNTDPHDRKNWAGMMEAFGIFHKKHPDSVFFGHTCHDMSEGGFDLGSLSHRHNFNITVPTPWQYRIQATELEMATMYSTFDVMLLPSKGEGFGVPIIEAQACGTPVIVTDWTAPRDLCGAGWKLPVVHKHWMKTEGYWGIPSVESIVEALEEAYDLWKQKKLDDEMKDKAIEFTKQFDFDHIIEKHFVPFLEDALDG